MKRHIETLSNLCGHNTASIFVDENRRLITTTYTEDVSWSLRALSQKSQVAQHQAAPYSISLESPEKMHISLGRCWCHAGLGQDCIESLSTMAQLANCWRKMDPRPSTNSGKQVLKTRRKPLTFIKIQLKEKKIVLQYKYHPMYRM